MTGPLSTDAPMHARPRETEAEAARKIKPWLNPMRARVLECVESSRGIGAAGFEIAAVLGLTVLNVRPRLTELERAGYIEARGKRTNPQGNNEIVYVRKQGADA